MCRHSTVSSVPRCCRDESFYPELRFGSNLLRTLGCGVVQGEKGLVQESNEGTEVVPETSGRDPTHTKRRVVGMPTETTGSEGVDFDDVDDAEHTESTSVGHGMRTGAVETRPSRNVSRIIVLKKKKKN